MPLTRVFAAAFLLLGIGFEPPAALAQDVDPAGVALARQILEATHASALGDQIGQQILSTMTSGMDAANPGKNEEVKEVLNDTALPMLHQMMPELLESTARVYAANFSVDELKQLLAFYQSDIGRKMVERTPEMVRQQGQVAQSIVGKMMPELNARVLDALSKHGLKKPNGI